MEEMSVQLVQGIHFSTRGGPYLPGGSVPFALLHLTGEEAEFQKCWASIQGSRTNSRLSYSLLFRAMNSHTVLSPLTLRG